MRIGGASQRHNAESSRANREICRYMQVRILPDPLRYAALVTWSHGLGRLDPCGAKASSKRVQSVRIGRPRL